MPIRPERKYLYPANWKTEIVPMIRARSEDQCEICGAINYSIVMRNPEFGIWKWKLLDDQFFGATRRETDGAVIDLKTPSHAVDGWQTPIRIILTVAHLNHDETDNRPENLAHLCQLHHNRHDAQHRAANAKARRERDKNKADGQTPIVSP